MPGRRNRERERDREGDSGERLALCIVEGVAISVCLEEIDYFFLHQPRREEREGRVRPPAAYMPGVIHAWT